MGNKKKPTGPRFLRGNLSKNDSVKQSPSAGQSDNKKPPFARTTTGIKVVAPLLRPQVKNKPKIPEKPKVLWGPLDKSGLKRIDVQEESQIVKDETIIKEETVIRPCINQETPRLWISYNFDDLITIRNDIIDSLCLDDNEELMSIDFFERLCSFVYKNTTDKSMIFENPTHYFEYEALRSTLHRKSGE